MCFCPWRMPPPFCLPRRCSSLFFHPILFPVHRRADNGPLHTGCRNHPPETACPLAARHRAFCPHPTRSPRRGPIAWRKLHCWRPTLTRPSSGQPWPAGSCGGNSLLQPSLPAPSSLSPATFSTLGGRYVSTRSAGHRPAEDLSGLWRSVFISVAAIITVLSKRRQRGVWDCL